MKRLITMCAVGALVFVLAPSAMAMMMVEPDAFAPGTVLNNAYPGVTLTALGEPGVLLNDHVVAIASPYASTGSNLFGNDDARTFPDSWGDGYYDWFRADFAAGALWVSLDFGTNDSGDNNAELKAYDIGGNLVASAGPTYVPGPVGNYLTLQVSAPNIAYIEAHWDNITRIENGFLDNLQFEPVPVPGAILLGILGLSVAGIKLRKFT